MTTPTTYSAPMKYEGIQLEVQCRDEGAICVEAILHKGEDILPMLDDATITRISDAFVKQVAEDERDARTA